MEKKNKKNKVENGEYYRFNYNISRYKNIKGHMKLTSIALYSKLLS
jgi:hypothetical protein